MRGPSGEAEDVVGQEIAVAVADAPRGDPAVEQRGPTVEVRVGSARDLVHHRIVEHVAGDPAQPVEVTVDAGAQLGGPRPRRRRPVTSTTPAWNRAIVRAIVRTSSSRSPPARTRTEQPAVVGEPTHDEDVVARAALPVDDVDDAEVHVRREPAVQLQLPLQDTFPGARAS